MKITSFAGVAALLLFHTLSFSQQPQGPGNAQTPLATHSEFECSGFIAPHALPRDVEVFSGADNDLYEVLHQFVLGDFVYLRSRGTAAMRVGDQFAVVRRDVAPPIEIAWVADKLQDQIQPPLAWFRLQRVHVRSLGHPYDNVGRVTVTAVTPQGAVARVDDVCDAVNTGDIVIPYQPRPIPQATPAATFSRFGAASSKTSGIIVAAWNSSNYLATGDIAYLNVGSQQGAAVGERFRVYSIVRDKVVEGWEGILSFPKLPREYLGELAILSVEKKSSVAIVTRAEREMKVGDGIQQE